MLLPACSGQSLIEKHFTHDKSLPDNDRYHAMDSADDPHHVSLNKTIRDLLGEHVTLHLWDHRNGFRICAVPPSSSTAWPGLRFDVDGSEDLLRSEGLVDSGAAVRKPAARIVEISLGQDATHSPLHSERDE